jgi:hypothetical protein
MNIQEKINEIGEYFRNKLLTGDYEFIDYNEYVSRIKIDNNYIFNVWVTGNPENNFDFYTYIDTEKPVMSGMKFTSNKDRLDAYKIMKLRMDKYRDTIIREEQEREFARLKKALGQ